MRIKFFFTALFILLMVPAMLAFETMSGDEVRISSSKEINDDFFVSGGDLLITPTIDGDLVVAGGVIEIGGKVSEDALIAGGSIEILGKVEDDVRVAGGDIKVGGYVGDDLIIAGGNVIISEEAEIGGDLVVFGGNVESRGNIDGKAVINAGNVKLGGTILGDVEINAGEIEILPGTVIEGGLNTTSESDVKIRDDVEIKGETNYVKIEKKKDPIESKVTSGVWKYLTALLVGSIMILLFEKPMMVFSNKITESFLRSTLVGLLFLFLTPIVAILLFITIIGIPLSLLLIVFYIILIYFSKIFVSMRIGGAILETRKKTKGYLILTFALGLLIWTILRMIPIVGFFVGLITILVGSGAFLISFRNKRKRRRKKAI